MLMMNCYESSKIRKLFLSAYAEIRINYSHSESNKDFLDLKQKFRDSAVLATGQQFTCRVTPYRTVTPIHHQRS